MFEDIHPMQFRLGGNTFSCVHSPLRTRSDQWRVLCQYRTAFEQPWKDIIYRAVISKKICFMQCITDTVLRLPCVSELINLPICFYIRQGSVRDLEFYFLIRSVRRVFLFIYNRIYCVFSAKNTVIDFLQKKYIYSTFKLPS